MNVKVTWIARMAAAAVALAAAPSQAQSTDFELERLQFNPNGSGSLTVWDGQLLPASEFRVGAAGHYEVKPLQLHRPDGFPYGILVKERATIHLAFAFAVMPWLEIDGQVPGVFFSSGTRLTSTAGDLEVPRGRAIGTPWVSARFPILWKGLLPIPLAVSGEAGVGIPIGRRNLYTNAGGVMFSPRLNAGFQVGQIEGAVELNALFRPEAGLQAYSGSVFDRVTNTWGAAVAVNTGGTGARVEVTGRVSRNFFAPGWGAELTAGLRLPFSAIGPELYLEAGPCTGNMIGQPDFRVYAGFAFGGPRKALGGGAEVSSPTLPLPPPKAEEAPSPAPEAPAAPPAPESPAAPEAPAPQAPAPEAAPPAPESPPQQ